MDGWLLMSPKRPTRGALLAHSHHVLLDMQVNQTAYVTCIVTVLHLMVIAIHHEPVVPQDTLVATGNADAIPWYVIKRETCVAAHAICVKCRAQYADRSQTPVMTCARCYLACH